jgi:hypothetical protein
VFGYCLHERTSFHDDSHEFASPQLIQYMEELLATGEYPHIADLMSTYGTNAAWARITAHSADPSRFERNLARILDGLEFKFTRPEKG